MNEIISIIANICGILGFFISIFAVTKVIKLTQQIKGDNNNTVSMKGDVGGNFVGRDKK